MINKIARLPILIIIILVLILSSGFTLINTSAQSLDGQVNTPGLQTPYTTTNELDGNSDLEIYLPSVLNGKINSKNSLPSWDSFADSIANGQRDIVRGVYVPGVLALRIVQQPEEDPNYIDNAPDTTTQFQFAANFGTIGLLAHNDKAGIYFSDLKPRDEVMLIYGDTSYESYRIKEVKRFQALEPYDPYSNFIELDTGKKYSSTEVFRLVYIGDGQLTFQTCIEYDGVPTWGRLFIIAELIS